VVTRLCCGQDHGGPVCPDGLVMCCLCFSRFSEGDLYVDRDGTRWDICESCGAGEQRRQEERGRPASMLQPVTFDDSPGEARTVRVVPVDESEDEW
jgi:hypothetical protein